MSEPEAPNGFGFKTPVVSAQVWGRWGAVLLLVTIALVAILAALGYSLWIFQQSLLQIHEEHSALVGWQQQQAEAVEAASCITALPTEGDDRITALRSGAPCYYAKYVYTPRPSGPQLVIPSVPAIRRSMPTPPERAPGPPERELPTPHPTWPASGAPARP